MTISVTLQRVGDLHVELTFVNDSADSITLARPRTGVDEFDGSYFEFEPRPAGFLGRSIKRSAYRDQDLLRLAPGEAMGISVRLSELYRGIQDRSRVRYLAAHPLSGAGSIPTLVVSNWEVL